jgi:flagellar basal-body rod modification protein FlgD
MKETTMSIETSSTTGVNQSTLPQPMKTQGSNTLGKNEFLTILTAQLAHQDPTSPMDSNAFVAQLAQFSALEQMQNTNDTLTQLLAVQQLSGQTAVVSMVGKDAIYKASEMDLSAGGSITVTATLDTPAADVVMEVDDADGNVVRRQSFGAMAAGTSNVTWDGLNDSGVAQLPGTYTIKVSATDISGNPVTVTQQSRGRITGVTFENGGTELMIGNTTISLSNVSEIQESSNTQ